MVRIAVCVCTRRRPKMLQKCLRSIERQVLPHGVVMHTVVVWNDTDCSGFHQLCHRSEKDEFFHVEIEPKVGISHARNAAMKTADRIGADFVAFIDDDEVAEVDWLFHLMSPSYVDYPIVQGCQYDIPPVPKPFWYIDKKVPNPKNEGRFTKTAIANNVRFSMDLFRISGLEFDISIGKMGGEDIDFFSRAYMLGYSIRRTNKAVTREFVHPERCTYRQHLYRAFWTSISDLRRDRKVFERIRMKSILSIPFYLIVGPLQMLFSILFPLFDIDQFKYHAMDGGKKIAKAIGKMAYFFGYEPRPYETVVGE